MVCNYCKVGDIGRQIVLKLVPNGIVGGRKNLLYFFFHVFETLKPVNSLHQVKSRPQCKLDDPGFKAFVSQGSALLVGSDVSLPVTVLGH